MAVLVKRRNPLIYTLIFFLVVLWIYRLSFAGDGTSIISTLAKQHALNSSAASSLFSPSSTTKSPNVAVITETRYRPLLVPLILHFISVLGPAWPIIIYTTPENLGLFNVSASLQRHLQDGSVSIRMLPRTVLFTNSDSVNQFMASTWLWEDLAPARTVLIFQSDSMVCANAATRIEDFLEWDFVGAPIREGLGRGMNGGFSLRRRETFLRIARENTWTGLEGEKRFEDRWFFERLLLLMEKQKKDGRAKGEEEVKLPGMEEAKRFSVETVDFPHPFGVHQVHRWLGEQMVNLDDWCPEWKICSTDYVQDVKVG